MLPGRVSERDVGVFAEEAVGACVWAQCTVGRGFIEVGVGGCVQQGVEGGGGKKRVRSKGGLLWSARNTHYTEKNCQLPESQISSVGTDRLPTVDFGPGCYPRMLARCLTHEGRNTVSGFFTTP